MLDDFYESNVTLAPYSEYQAVETSTGMHKLTCHVRDGDMTGLDCCYLSYAINGSLVKNVTAFDQLTYEERHNIWITKGMIVGIVIGAMVASGCLKISYQDHNMMHLATLLVNPNNKEQLRKELVRYIAKQSVTREQQQKDRNFKQLESKKKQLQNQYNQLSKQYKKVNIERNKWQQVSKEHNATIQVMNRQASKKNKVLIQCKKEKQQLQKAYDELLDKDNSSKKSATNKDMTFEKVNEEKRNLFKKLKKTTQNQKKLQKEYNKLDNNNQKLVKEHATMQEKINELEEGAKSANETIEKLTISRSVLVKKSKKNDKTISRLKEDKVALVKKNSLVTEQYTRLENDHKQLSSNYQEEKKKGKKLLAENRKLSKQLQNAINFLLVQQTNITNQALLNNLVYGQPVLVMPEQVSVNDSLTMGMSQSNCSVSSQNPMLLHQEQAK